MSWSVSGENKTRGYNFTYDNLSRLTGAGCLENGNANDRFNTSYAYDKHGNMTLLSRRGNTGTTTYGLIDNLIKDYNKSITEISYNVLNLPQTLKISSATNTYTYAADGRKLKTVLGGSKTTDYCGNVIYENGLLKRILVDGGYIENGTYYFYLTDHLGNNRVIASSSGSIVQSNHYYPFGMSFAEGSATSQQPYKYNGKELDTERGLNLYDYSARYMDPALGRFNTVDPMAEKYYSISPYAYCATNPVNRIDPDGRDWRVTTRYNEETQKIEYNMTVNAVLYNNSKDSNIDMELLSTAIQQQINEVYNTSGDGFAAKMDFNLRIVSSVDEIGDRDHVFQLVDQSDLGESSKGTIMAKASTPGLNIKIGSVAVSELLNGTDKRTVAHELGHTGGLLHLVGEENVNNLMTQAVEVNKQGGNYSKSTQLNKAQIMSIRDNYINNKLNFNSPIRSGWFRKYVV